MLFDGRADALRLLDIAKARRCPSSEHLAQLAA